MKTILTTILMIVLIVPTALFAAVSDGVDFLHARQDGAGLVDGSIRSTDWGVIGVSAVDTDPATVGSPSLIAAITNNPASSTSATDLERRILALRAAGQPASAEVSQLASLTSDSQIGSSDRLNDDVFGVLALTAAGGASTTIANSVAFIQSHQNTDGGFSSFVGGGSDVDSTAAALTALVVGGGSIDTINRGFDYLAIRQEPNGGFGVQGGGSSANVDSTSWVLWAYHTAGRSNPAAQTWLASQQHGDGSYGGAVSTAYALIALSDRAVPIIGSFAVPVPAPILEPAPPIPAPQPGQVLPARPARPSRPISSADRVAVSSSASASVGSASAVAIGTGASVSANAADSHSGSLKVETSASHGAVASSSPPPAETTSSRDDGIRSDQATSSSNKPDSSERRTTKSEDQAGSVSAEPDGFALSNQPSTSTELSSSLAVDPEQRALIRNLIVAIVLVAAADCVMIGAGIARALRRGSLQPDVGPSA